jgi:hypothetical protein
MNIKKEKKKKEEPGNRKDAQARTSVLRMTMNTTSGTISFGVLVQLLVQIFFFLSNG